MSTAAKNTNSVAMKKANSVQPLTLITSIDHFPLKNIFTIARGSRDTAVVVTVKLQQNGYIGQGECVPYARYNETPESVLALLAEHKTAIENSLTQQNIKTMLPEGAARNALDCALWDLKAKQTGIRVYQSCGLTTLKPVKTCYTISLASPDIMAKATKAATKAMSETACLKIKLGSDQDIEIIKAVRNAAPKATLLADANEGWTAKTITSNLKACEAAGYAMVEQPLKADDDAMLEHLSRNIPLCADESIHGIKSLNRVKSLYDAINIKLDKTGGLTAALELQNQARLLGLKIMVGCMVSSSLSMAPAFILAQNADFVDLDGPLLLANDRENGHFYEGNIMHPASHMLWG